MSRPSITIDRYGVIGDGHHRQGIYKIGKHGEKPENEPWTQGLPKLAEMSDWRRVMIVSEHETMLADKILRQDDTQASDWRVNIQLDGLAHLSVLPVGSRICIFDDKDVQICQLVISARNSPCMSTGNRMFENCGTELASRDSFKEAFTEGCQFLRGVMAYPVWPAVEGQKALIKIGYRVGIQERY